MIQGVPEGVLGPTPEGEPPKLADGQPLFATQPPVKPKRTRARARAVSPPPPAAPSFDERLAHTKAEAKRLAKEKRTKIPLRIQVSLETHEVLVAIAAKIGAATVQDVAGRSLEVGAEHWAKAIKIRTPEAVQGLTVFERTPAAANTHDYGGPNEQRVRDELAAEAARKNQLAEELHLPGRRRAVAS